MSVAEKLKVEGRLEGKFKGRLEGQRIGRIQLLEEVLELPESSSETLAKLGGEELESMVNALQKEYEMRFKRP